MYTTFTIPCIQLFVPFSFIFIFYQFIYTVNSLSSMHCFNDHNIYILLFNTVWTQIIQYNDYVMCISNTSGLYIVMHNKVIININYKTKGEGNKGEGGRTRTWILV